MARPTGWDVLGLDGDPTPGVVESVQALAKQFGDFSHDVEAAYHNLNSFGSDATAMQWIGKTADAFKDQYGPLPGRLQKLYTSYSEASDALSAYWPALQAAQTKADTALRQAQDAHADLQRATTTANTAATDLKTARQNQAATPNQQAVTDAQTAHDTAQTNLNNAKAKMAALTKQANDAYNDRINAAKTCQSALGKAQGDGIHNKSWWDHVAEDLSEWGGKIADIANELAPFLDVLALATSWIPGVDVITAGLAEADNLIAMIGTGMKIAGDAMQGHWGDALMGVGMVGLQFVGGKAVEKVGGKLMDKYGGKLMEKLGARGNKEGVCLTDPVDVVSGWMLTEETDLALPGVLPLFLNRAYNSAYETGRLFGPGWASTLDQRLSINGAGIHFAGDDAQLVDYAIPAAEEEVLPARGSRWPLVWDRQTDEIRITEPRSGHTRHFAVVHYRDDVGEIRDLTAISDRNGNRIDFLRDENGTPTTVEHSGGYRVAIETAATPSGTRVTAIRLLDRADGAGGTDADGGSTLIRRFSYDDQGRLTGVINDSGLPYRYGYDEADRITSWADRVGYRYTYEYDTLGRVVRTTGDHGFMSGAFVYDEPNNTTTFTDSRGARSVYQYDDEGHLTTVTDPFGNTTSLRHDRLGRILSCTDPLGNTTDYRRDDRGNVVEVRNPDGTSVAIAYNDLGLATAITEPGGAIWSREYDLRGNLVTVTDPLGAETVYRYAGNGARLAVIDALGHTVRFDCDVAGLPLAITDPLGGTIEAERDAFGRIVAVTDALQGRTTTGWTVDGLPAWQVGPDGARQEWRYDPENCLVSYSDPLGETTGFEPGPFGKVLARTDPNGARYVFAYDTELNLVSVTNPADARWQYTYDAAGRLVSETDFIGRTLDFTHDAAGRLVRKTTGSGHEMFFERDWAGRLLRRRTAGEESAYQYDLSGNLIAASGRDSAVTITRGADGRILSETVDGRTLTNEYDRAGRRVRRTTPTGVVSTWSFDAAGRAAELATSAGRLAFDRDAAGREIARALGPDTWLLRDFDAAGRLATQQVWSGDRPHTLAGPGGASPEQAGRLVVGRHYAYRSDGMPSEITDTLRGIRRFGSDELGRVTSVDGASWSESYAYDAFGNLTQSVLPGGDDASGARETDRTLIRRAGRTSYEHDDAGRLVKSTRRTLSGQRKVWTYSWDTEDHLARVTLPDGTTWRYVYDPMGRRTAKARIAADGSVAEWISFVWDGMRLAEQHAVGPDGAVTALTWDYDPGTFQPAAQTRRSWAKDADQQRVDEVFHAIITDLAGAPTELVTPDGRIAWHTTASLWGRTIAVSAEPDVDCPLRFPGQYHDGETGLHYNVHRYYDPDTASYLTADPLGLTPAPNDRSYVSNPLVWIDPLGLMCKGRDTEYGGLTDDDYEAMRISHNDEVAEGVDYQIKRMHDGTSGSADHEIPGIGHDPQGLADYFQSWQGKMTHYDHVRGSNVAFDSQKNVLIVETADKIHGFKYDPDKFNTATTKNGNPRYTTL
ncbi:RHS repeat-associated protein [Catenulispora sp. MAP12-49]|uniref:DUF6531 domain-containing protein n=1 Tax=Catenulispora sp. MAP12-49 TaxID=3156302 RepID=UPI0035182FC6